MIREIQRLRDYHQKDHEFAFWREGTHEIDLLIMGGRGPLMAIECKSGKDLIRTPTLEAFRQRFPKVPLIIASLQDRVARRLESGIEVLPWNQAIERYKTL